MLNILYQDDALVAIDKTAGLLAHKSNIDQHESANAMHQLRDQIGQWVYPIHRLDKATSGVLLFALTPEMAALMGELFSAHKIEKTYIAIVRGYVETEGVIDYALRPIVDFKQDKQRYKEKPRQQAITKYHCLAKAEIPYAVDKYPQARYSLVKLLPKTGRKHQLRRHMKHISHPIIGDKRYGKASHNQFFENHYGFARLFLSAYQLTFCHPFSKENTIIEGKLDEEFKALNKDLFGEIVI